MKIAYFTHTYPRATDTFIRREVRALRALGIEVRTYSVHRAAGSHQVSAEIRLEQQNTAYLRSFGLLRLLLANFRLLCGRPRAFLGALLLACRTTRPGLRGFLLQMAYFQEAVALAVLLERDGITHLHNHLGDTSGTVTMLAGRLTGIGYSITIHGPHIFFDPTHWALREKVRLSRFIACISHYCRSQMMLFSDMQDWDRLKIIHCGVNPDQYQYREVRPVARKLLYSGRLAAEKGLPVLFESLRLLAAKGHDFELTLLGDGEHGAALKRLAVELQIDRRLTFTGFVGEDVILQHLKEADIFILPSFAEGVPVSLMEAMACGVPVIATAVGGVTELVRHGSTGLVVPPADSQALCEQLERYLTDHALRQAISGRARDFVRSDFSLAIEAGKLAELYATAAQEPMAAKGGPQRDFVSP